MPRLDYGWCKTHGISNCPLEHPEVAQLKSRPQITATQLAQAQRVIQFANRPENNNKCKLYQRRIQFESREAVEKAGIDVAPAWQEQVVESVSASGQVTYDQTLMARLSSRLRGTVWRVDKQLGDQVRVGEVLALVEAVEVGKAKSELLLGLTQVDLKRMGLERTRQSYNKGALPLTSLNEAETELREAEIRVLAARQELINLGMPIRSEELRGFRPEEVSRRLQFLGIPESVSRTLDTNTTTANLLPIKASIAGSIVLREVVQGEVVEAGKVLFAVADTRQLWLTLAVRLEDAKAVAVGQPVFFRPDGSDMEVTGKISWISPAADEKTRTIAVRASLDNTLGQLRAFTFGAGRIILREEKEAVVVPNEAIQSDGDCMVVFVRDKNYFEKDAPKVFHVRTIRPGTRSEKFTEVAAGVLPGEVVATKGSGVLRAELLKNNLGEG
jgi:cobalt-zinc-cadmium efflux system membrane fusion protein